MLIGALPLCLLIVAGCAPAQVGEPGDRAREPSGDTPGDTSGDTVQIASACSHPVCSTGGPLTASCNSCAKKVCAADSYCCTTAWNSICVAEAGRLCGETCAPPDMGEPGPDLAHDPADMAHGPPGRFRFAAFGDTRPGSPSAGSPYPTAVVEAIFRAIDRQAVDFVVVSGDYIYVTGTDATRAGAQMDLFLGARKQLSAATPVHYVLGNHEDNNIPTFQAKLSPQVYWRFDQGGAKFVAIANDAWDSTQATWLDKELGTSTKYTFVFRHQYWGSHGTTHDGEIQPIVDAHPYTLFIAGHDHSYKHKTSVVRGAQRDVVAGNGGAPFDSGWDSPYYGYILVEQQADDSVRVTSYKVEPGMDVPPTAMDSWSVAP